MCNALDNFVTCIVLCLNNMTSPVLYSMTFSVYLICKYITYVIVHICFSKCNVTSPVFIQYDQSCIHTVWPVLYLYSMTSPVIFTVWLVLCLYSMNNTAFIKCSFLCLSCIYIYCVSFYAYSFLRLQWFYLFNMFSFLC